MALSDESPDQVSMSLGPRLSWKFRVLCKFLRGLQVCSTTEVGNVFVVVVFPMVLAFDVNRFKALWLNPNLNRRMLLAGVSQEDYLAVICASFGHQSAGMVWAWGSVNFPPCCLK